MISHRHKFIFTRTTKTASTSIVDALDDLFDVTEFPEWYQEDPRHVPLWAIRTYISEDIYNNYFKWAMVRNPFARAVSTWKYHIKWSKLKNKPYNDNFLDYMRIITEDRKKVKNLDLYSFTEGCDFIGRVENIVEDFAHVCGVIGIEPRVLKRKNKTNHAPYSTYYCPETKEIVQDVYSNDIKHFNYTFE